MVSDNKRNSNVSTYHHSLADQPDSEYYGQIYDQARYPLLYKNILQHEESAAFGIHSGKGYEHTSNLKQHLNDLRMKKNKSKRKMILEQSESQSLSESELNEDEDEDPLVQTTVTYSEPHGFHVNLDVNIAISQVKTAGQPCLCENYEIIPNINGIQKKKNNIYSQEKNSKKCEKTRNLAVVFFLPRGCYADQQEIEVKRSSALLLCTVL